MPDLHLVLVDTSVWVRFFRAEGSANIQALDQLLSLAAVATCGPIRAEVISGAKTRREFQRLRDLFTAVRDLPPPDGIWNEIEAHRFALARRGYQASLVDLWIALTAHAHGVALWILDEDFQHIAAVVPFKRYIPDDVAA